jgi:hypothetical protein
MGVMAISMIIALTVDRSRLGSLSIEEDQTASTGTSWGLLHG